MKKIKASLDSIPLTLHVPETEDEYREGIRTLGGSLPLDEGMLFHFFGGNQIIMENSGVNHPITLLFFISLGRGTSGIVSEIKQMNRDDGAHVKSQGSYSWVLEVRKEFFESYNLRPGSILQISDRKALASIIEEETKKTIKLIKEKE